MADATLKKQERLTGSIAVNAVFNTGKSFFLYPYLVFALKRTTSEDTPQVRLLISVSKKNFKRAVKRNFIKRQIRESFRINKSLVNSALNDEHYDIGVVYVSKQLHDSAFMQQKLLKVISKLKGKDEHS